MGGGGPQNLRCPWSLRCPPLDKSIVPDEMNIQTGSSVYLTVNSLLTLDEKLLPISKYMVYHEVTI